MTGFIVPDWPAPANVHAIATTREGGVSQGLFASLNLADHVGDDAAAVAINRRRLHALLSQPTVEPLWLAQVHGNQVVRADEELPGAVADASVCTDASRACAILSADCLPVLLCDGAGTVVAAAHAGWRGLAGGVIEATIVGMHIPPAHLMAWLGPAISQDAFEVGTDVYSTFTAHDPAAATAFTAGAPGKWQCDLYALARQRLAQAGVKRVFGGGFCTFSDARRFFSYRRDRQTGRMATLIWLDRATGRV